MNAMGFDAACIGNHEFDYGVVWMQKRKMLADFPLLSCNIVDVGTDNLANFTVPYVIQNHSGINVGIVGLTTTSTYTSSHPKVTQDFDFLDYEQSLRNYVPVVKADGADIIIVLAHVPPSSLVSLASDVNDLGISVFLGGHSGSPTVDQVGSSIIAMASHKAKQYAKIILTVDKESKEVVSSNGTLIDNLYGEVTDDPAIQTVVDYWNDRVNASEIITWTSRDSFDYGSESEIGNLITDSFLYYFNNSYSFGIANRGGGFRDYFRQGDISIADVVSVVPFENNLLSCNLTGQQLNDLIEKYQGGLAFSGIRFGNSTLSSFYVLNPEEQYFEKIQPAKTYTGLILDYVWWVYFKNDFPTIDTGVHYRDAVIKYFRVLDDLSNHTTDNRYTTMKTLTETNSLSINGYGLISLLMAALLFYRRKIYR
ncbi:MAG: bifunctional metallophosphatase/5'-nucleotidase, partial [Candidatus Hodarchaeales archaeon]